VKIIVNVEESPVASNYHDRPWRHLYPPGMPADITPTHADALSMWRASASADANRPFLYYFDAMVHAATVEAESDALAVALAARGLTRGDRIALYLQNVPQFLIGLLAAWKLAAIAVPVNPMLKERELRYILRDCGARAIISLQDLWNAAAATAVEGTAVEVAITTSPLDYLGAREVPRILSGIDRVATPGATDLAGLLREHAGARPVPVTLGPADVAVLTYTSGTTGEPKGAMNTHGNVTFNACVYRDWIGLTPDDVVLAAAPLFHITGLIGHAAVAMLVPMPMVLGYRFEPTTAARSPSWRSPRSPRWPTTRRSPNATCRR
jgi:long-chain acyl-CoA synthetase